MSLQSLQSLEPFFFGSFNDAFSTDLFPSHSESPVTRCFSPGYCRRSWRPTCLCLLARARSERTERCCWPELRMSFRGRRTKIPSSSICLATSSPGSKTSLGRSLPFSCEETAAAPLCYFCGCQGAPDAPFVPHICSEGFACGDW